MGDGPMAGGPRHVDRERLGRALRFINADRFDRESWPCCAWIVSGMTPYGSRTMTRRYVLWASLACERLLTADAQDAGVAGGMDAAAQAHQIVTGPADG